MIVKTPAWQLIFHPLDSNSDIRENCLSYKLEKRAVANDIWPFYTVFLSVTGSWQSFLQERQQTFMTTMTSFKRHFRPSRVNHGKKQVLKRSSKAKKVPAHHCQAGELWSFGGAPWDICKMIYRMIFFFSDKKKSDAWRNNAVLAIVRKERKTAKVKSSFP